MRIQILLNEPTCLPVVVAAVGRKLGCAVKRTVTRPEILKAKCESELCMKSSVLVYKNGQRNHVCFMRAPLYIFSICWYSVNRILWSSENSNCLTVTVHEIMPAERRKDRRMDSGVWVIGSVFLIQHHK